MSDVLRWRLDGSCAQGVCPHDAAILSETGNGARLIAEDERLAAAGSQWRRRCAAPTGFAGQRVLPEQLKLLIQANDQTFHAGNHQPRATCQVNEHRCRSPASLRQLGN